MVVIGHSGPGGGRRGIRFPSLEVVTVDVVAVSGQKFIVAILAETWKWGDYLQDADQQLSNVVG